MPAPSRVLRASWSSTLCLPKSTFPPRPIPADRQKYLDRCTDKLYAWQRSAPELSGKKPFVLHDGPPYANGSLHIGHALNKITKDIILRVQLAHGRPIEYVPGWDCHGLPIELKALQLRQSHNTGANTKGEEKGEDAVEVRQLARSLALKTIDEQRDNFRAWGIIGDWDNPYRTLDKDFELRQLEVFRQMLATGLIYRRYKPVYWSPSTGTALAEAELEYKEDHVSHSAYVTFEAQNEHELMEKFGMACGEGSKIKLLIWTTTPWTLPANKFIAVHEDLDYVCVRFEGIGHVVLAQSRLAEVEKICGASHQGPVLGPVKGSQLVGTQYKNDAFKANQTGTLLSAGFVSADSGTGLVHCAPGHGFDDYHLGLKHGVDPFAPVDDSGHFTDDVSDKPGSAELLRGKTVTGEGNKAVIQYLRDSTAEHGVKIIASQKYKHKYPYDWRSKQPVIIRATAQWFADVGEIRQATLQEIENIKFIPASGKERLTSFVKTRSEWCISRQRAWGVPIPALYEKDTGKALLTPASVTHVMSVIKDRGIDAWWTDAVNDEAWVPPENRHVLYERGRDTMDVWFDSGTTWTHMGKTDTGFAPRSSDVYLEGSDQHRGWFQSSILTKIAYDSAKGAKPQAPFKTLITHGFTLDGTGKKMSKSLGNVIAPDEITNGTMLPPLKRKGKQKASASHTPTYDALGPDALRLWAAASDYTKDVNVGEAVLKANHALLSKLRVTFKLLTGILEDFPVQSYRRHLVDLEPVDMAAMVHLSDFSQSAWNALSEYEHHRAVAALSNYVNADFSAFYMETIKDRIYTEAMDSSSRRDAQFVLWHIFQELCSILRPIIPLLVEEARDHLQTDKIPGEGFAAFRTLHQADFHWTETPALKLREHSGAEDRLQMIMDTLPILLQLRAAAMAIQEEQRASKTMGSSLQSGVIIRPNTVDAMRSLGKITQVWRNPHLEDLFVVSQVKVDQSLDADHETLDILKAAPWHQEMENASGSGFTVCVHGPVAHKCERCWKYNVKEEENSICTRCESVVGRNEARNGS